MLATDAAKLMAELGGEVPKIEFRKEVVMGKSFDTNDPEGYLKTLR